MRVDERHDLESEAEFWAAWNKGGRKTRWFGWLAVVDSPRVCPTCRGGGMSLGADGTWKVCPRCRGEGSVE